MSAAVRNLIFDVFLTPEDHFDWDKHILYVELSEVEADEAKQRLIKALQFLRKEFGEDFLRLNNHNHPVYRMVTEKAPWRITEVTKFACTLQRLKESDINYPILLGKLMQADSCRAEGLPFVEIAGMFMQTGCGVQVWKEIKSQRNPDLAISFPGTNETFYIEVSKVNESKVRSDLDSNYKVISRLLNITAPQLPFSCQLFRYISDSEMPDVLANITSCREQALTEKNIVHHHDEIMRLCVTHPDKFEEFEKWVEKHNYRKGLHGPPLNFDETSRIIKYKIGQEMEQIPAGSTGMIYLPVHPLYFGVMDPERIASEFEKKMAAHPLLFGIVLYSTIITECKPSEVFVNGHYFSVRKLNETVVRFLAFLKNPTYTGNLSEDAKSIIYKSLC